MTRFAAIRSSSATPTATRATTGVHAELDGARRERDGGCRNRGAVRGPARRPLLQADIRFEAFRKGSCNSAQKETALIKLQAIGIDPVHLLIAGSSDAVSKVDIIRADQATLHDLGLR